MALPRPDIFGRFDDAVDYFRERVPLTSEEWDALTQQARQEAFTVANVAQADVIQDVLESLVKAQDEGLSLKEWRDGIEAKLLAAWDGSVENPPHRLNTIFRTNVQTASSHGRIRQMSHPDVVKLRPYRLYDATKDKRTTDICTKRHRVLLRADDPWWSSNTPPLHFNCRSRIRALRKAQAMRRGGVKRPPATTPPSGEGFGEAPVIAPAEQVKHVEVERNYDPTLDAVFRRKEQRADLESIAVVRRKEQRADLESIAGGLAGGDASVAREAIRRRIKSELAIDSNDTKRKLGGAGKLTINKALEHKGVHDWDGSVQLRPEVAAEAESGFRRLASGRPVRWHEANAMRVVLHEEFHGTSPITRATYGGYALKNGKMVLSGPAALEEAQTEVLALRFMARLGLSPDPSYTQQIGDLARLIRKAEGRALMKPSRRVNGKDVFRVEPDDLERIEGAATRLRRKVTELSSARQHVELFVKELGLTPAAEKRLIKLLSGPADEWQSGGRVYRFPGD